MKSKDFKCEFCGGKTTKVYETKRNLFLQCPLDHTIPNPEKPNDPQKFHAPVFMIAKTEFEDFSKGASGDVS